jgi:hypothetical protein
MNNKTENGYTLDIFGHHIGDRIDLKKIKNSLSFPCTYADPTEMMYAV